MKTWSFRACALTAALLVLAPILVPLSAHAMHNWTLNLCNPNTFPAVTGSGISNYQKVDYSSDGWVQFHFQFEPNVTTDSVKFVANKQPAEFCGEYQTWGGEPVSMLKGLQKFSIRATSYSLFWLYNDETNEPVRCANGDTSCGRILISPLITAEVSDRINFGFELADGSGLVSSVYPIWDPSRPYPKRPVLIIPGVTGTTLVRGTDTLWPDKDQLLLSGNDDFMDPLAYQSDLKPVDGSVQAGEVIDQVDLLHEIPVFDYTAGLIKTLTAAGYKKDKNLFVMPYDWRNPIEFSSPNIVKIQQQTGFWFIDVIAHSMGGLVLKQYINKATLPAVKKAIFVGTPFLGAPKALKTLLFGDNFDVPVLSPAEIQKIGTNLPSLYQLLPSRKYYGTIGTAVGLTQPLNYEETMAFGKSKGLNGTAWQLADQFHSTEFDSLDMRNKGVDVYNIVGCGSPTLQSIKQHELIDGTVLSGYAPTFTWGDGTVPTMSAVQTTTDQNKTLYATNVDHGRMLSQSNTSSQIANILAGREMLENSISYDSKVCGISGKLVSVFSPVDISVQSGGSTVGHLLDGQIRRDLPNAGYEELGDHKFLFWADDLPAAAVNLQGTASGTFTLSVETIKDNQSISTATYTDIPVTESLAGKIELASDSGLSLDTDGDGQVDETLPPTTITLPDTKPPEINLGFNPTTHSLDFSGQDEVSNPTIVDQGTSITTTDAAGNTTALQLDRQDGKKSFKVQFTGLVYNGQAATFAGMKMSYSWSSDNLTQDWTLADASVKAVFDGKNTKITVKPISGKGQTQSMPGLVLLRVQTDRGGLHWYW